MPPTRGPRNPSVDSSADLFESGGHGRGISFSKNPCFHRLLCHFCTEKKRPKILLIPDPLKNSAQPVFQAVPRPCQMRALPGHSPYRKGIPIYSADHIQTLSGIRRQQNRIFPIPQKRRIPRTSGNLLLKKNTSRRQCLECSYIIPTEDPSGI